MTPYLKTKRLRLYAPCHRAFDIERHVSWLTDKETMKYSGQRHHSHSIQSQTVYVRGFASDCNPHHLWEISRSDGSYDFPIGTLTAYRNRHDNTANLGLLIGRPFWGNGYGYEAWQAVMDWLFSDGVRKIEAGCYGRNLGMQAIFRKSGMKIEGCRHNSVMLDDGPDDIIEVGKLNAAQTAISRDGQTRSQSMGSVPRHLHDSAQTAST